MTISYKRNFISKAVIRVDFIDNLQQLNDALPVELRTSILSSFKIPEEHSHVQKNYHIDATNDELTTGDSTSKIWKFFTLDRKNSISILQNAIVFECDSYQGFEHAKELFLSVINAFKIQYPNTQISRLGLRYINDINLDYKLVKSGWAKYLNKALIQQDFIKSVENGKATRSLGLIEFRYEDLVNIRFQYGVPNKDYPAAIADPAFLLDYDASVSYAQNFDELRENIESAHTKLSELFEKSITDKLRGILNE